jgi:hypothetical protein
MTRPASSKLTYLRNRAGPHSARSAFHLALSLPIVRTGPRNCQWPASGTDSPPFSCNLKLHTTRVRCRSKRRSRDGKVLTRRAGIEQSHDSRSRLAGSQTRGNSLTAMVRWPNRPVAPHAEDAPCLPHVSHWPHGALRARSRNPARVGLLLSACEHSRRWYQKSANRYHSRRSKQRAGHGHRGGQHSATYPGRARTLTLPRFTLTVTR